MIGTLSVAENLFLNRLPHTRWIHSPGCPARRGPGRARAGRSRRDRSGLPAGVLGVGQQQLVEIAGALSQRCQLLILDEPTAALTDPEIAQLFDNVRRLKADGVGIVYVSHRMEEIRRVADRISVMRDGRRIATHDVNDASADQLVREMVGHDLPNRSSAPARPAGDIALSVRHARAGDAVRDVSLEVRGGEIVGIAGLIGSGRTELLRAIFGADPIDCRGSSRRRRTGRHQHARGCRQGRACAHSRRPQARRAPDAALCPGQRDAQRNPGRSGRLARWRRRIAHRQRGVRAGGGPMRLDRPAGDGVERGNQQKVMIARSARPRQSHPALR